MIFGATDKRDIVQKMKQTAKIAFSKDPSQAIEMGLTNEEGIPLDNRETWSTGRQNPGYNKPLPEHNWIRTVFGIAKLSNEDTSPQFFRLNMNGAVAECDNIPLFIPIKFRAINKTDIVAEELTFNSSTFTKFNPIKTDMGSIIDLITKFANKYALEINQLDDFHQNNKTDFNRLVLIKGDISTLIMEPTSNGTRRMILESESAIEDLDAIGLTCWVPKHINIDFAENSKVIVLASTSQGKKYVDGVQTEELGDISLNVFGLYAIPEYKILIDVEEITEENTPTEEESITPEEIIKVERTEQEIKENSTHNTTEKIEEQTQLSSW